MLQWQGKWEPCDTEWRIESILKDFERELRFNPRHPLYGKKLQPLGQRYREVILHLPDDAQYAHVRLTHATQVRPAFPRCTILATIDEVQSIIARTEPAATGPESDQPEFTGVMDGIIIEFLTLNRFRVRQNDGQVVNALMPDELLPIAIENRHLLNDPKYQFLSVEVEIRDPPAMHRILTVHLSGLSG